MKRMSSAIQRRHKYWRWGLSIGFFAALIFFGGILLYRDKTNPFSTLFNTPALSRLVAWIGDHKAHVRQNVVKVKQLVTNKEETEPAIHFEFYTALPDMQVTVPGSVSAVSQVKKIVTASDLEKE